MKKRMSFLLAMASAVAIAETITVPVATVVEQPYFSFATYPGRIVPISRVNIVPQVSGEILEVCFDNGAIVKEGDVLYRLDPVKYEAAFRNAEAKLAECKANVEYAELSYARHQKLLGTRAVSLDAVDNALSLRDSSRAALAAAKAALASAKDDLDHCTIVAPISGKIGSTAMTKGNYAKAAGDALVSIVQLSPIRVSFSISNRRFLDLFGGTVSRLAADAELSLALANGTVYDKPGKFDYIENTADELTDTIQVYFEYQNPDGLLRPNGVLSVSLSTKKGEKRTAVPPSAVLQDVQGSYVWCLDENNVATRRAIARGDLVGDWVFVEKGLKVGDRFVANGAHKVRRGMTIEAAK